MNDKMVSRGSSNMGVVAGTEETKKIAEVQAKMILARQFPRDVGYAQQMIEYECQNPELAETAIYEFPKGDSVVRGASIRLVECIQRYWGNMVSGVEELSNTATGAVVRAYAWDLESNFADEKVFEVEYIRTTKKGSYPLTDPRDKYEMMSNQAARRKRACIQAVIPKFIIDKAMAICQETLDKQINKDGVEDTKAQMLEAFRKIADWIDEAMLAAVCGKEFDKLGSRDIVKLRHLYTAIQDGFVKPEAAFKKEDAAKPDTAESESLDKLNEELAAEMTEKKGETKGAVPSAAIENEVSNSAPHPAPAGAERSEEKK